MGTPPSSQLHSGGTMRREETKFERTIAITRRRFVQGMAAGAALAACGWKERSAFGETASTNSAVLTGTHFDLTIDSIPVNFTGRPARATAVNGATPGPNLGWMEGDTVILSVTNRLKHATSIHWHGVRVPADMDGVPGLSFAGIPPGETFEYRFPVRQSGTYWYHSHSGFQEQTGLIGAVIIDPRNHDPVEFDREYVVLLSDWTDSNPETVFSNLKAQSDYYNYHKRWLRFDRLATACMGSDEHEPNRYLRRDGCCLYLFAERKFSQRELDRIISRRRTNSSSLYQRFFHDILRSPRSRLEDDRCAGGRQRCRTGHRR
jgi:FtsP/CotA-like multicopper oxidase with cupredoxin domain